MKNTKQVIIIASVISIAIVVLIAGAVAVANRKANKNDSVTFKKEEQNLTNLSPTSSTTTIAPTVAKSIDEQIDKDIENIDIELGKLDTTLKETEDSLNDQSLTISE